MRTGAELSLSINYDSPCELRAFLDTKGLGMRKKYGQNFLVNSGARKKLLDALLIKKGDAVWEIGPGLGAMTKGLLERGANVTAFEIDPAFSRALKEIFGSAASFCLVEGDVLKTWPSLKHDGELFLFGNLPYNIAAALIADFIEKGRLFGRMVVTVQREVAQRMAAKPGSSCYSSFSVLCSSVYKVKLLDVIKSASFYPEPRIDSQGVLLEKICDRGSFPKLFTPLVRSLFSSRRKTVRNTLSVFAASAIIEKEKTCRELAEEILIKAGVQGERRPETLDIEEFRVLAQILEKMVSGV